MSATRTPLPFSGNVHWLGAGLSSGSGIEKIAKSASLTLWNRTKANADALLERLGCTKSVRCESFSLEALKKRLAPGDIVVCLLPVTLHQEVAELACLHDAHYVSASYVSPAIKDIASTMESKNLVCLVEAGLDPGIDHVLAHLLVEESKRYLDDASLSLDDVTFRFTSYCGGFPEVPNDFRYKFSWSPLGVLKALASPATWVEKSAEQTTHFPWEAVRTIDLDCGSFEAYPNRNSLDFIDQYHLPKAWPLETFVRGTLRLEGWSKAWQEVFATVKQGSPEALETLAKTLNEKQCYLPGENDRVVMAVALEATSKGSTVWKKIYEIDDRGNATESSMARCVSLMAASSVIDVIAGEVPSGLTLGVSDTGHCQSIVDRLGDWGIGIRAI